MSRRIQSVGKRHVRYHKTKGRDLEASTLLNAVKLYLEGRLEVYWGKVITKSHA